jgi:hypothetical protein
MMAQYPQINKIVTVLDEEDLKFYHAAIKSGLNPLEAFTETWAYQTQSALGFTSVRAGYERRAKVFVNERSDN